MHIVTYGNRCNRIAERQHSPTSAPTRTSTRLEPPTRTFPGAGRCPILPAASPDMQDSTHSKRAPRGPQQTPQTRTFPGAGRCPVLPAASRLTRRSRPTARGPAPFPQQTFRSRALRGEDVCRGNGAGPDSQVSKPKQSRCWPLPAGRVVPQPLRASCTSGSCQPRSSGSP